MLLYKCFRFSEVMDQMFLTVRGAVQGSFRATLGLLMPSYDQDGDPPPPTHTHLGFFLWC